jgi:hypothetical protein
VLRVLEEVGYPIKVLPPEPLRKLNWQSRMGRRK